MLMVYLKVSRRSGGFITNGENPWEGVRWKICLVRPNLSPRWLAHIHQIECLLQTNSMEILNNGIVVDTRQVGLRPI